jgi:hypothetical protein
LLRKPITGSAGCCARAASGHAAAKPATTLMKSRRRTRPSSERLRTTPVFKAYQIGRRCPLSVKSRHVRCKRACPLYPNSDREGGFPQSPNSGHVQRTRRCPLRANSGHSRKSFNQLGGKLVIRLDASRFAMCVSSSRSTGSGVTVFCSMTANQIGYATDCETITLRAFRTGAATRCAFSLMSVTSHAKNMTIAESRPAQCSLFYQKQTFANVRSKPN